LGQKSARSRDRSDLRSAAISRSDIHNHRSFQIPPKYGFKIKAQLHRDGRGHLNARMPKDVLRKYLGEESCIFAIEGEGKALYKWWNPGAKKIDREIPKWLGEKKGSIEITIRKVSTIEYIKEVNRGGLPFGVKIGAGGRYYIVVGSRAIPVEATGIHWEGGFRNAVYLTLKIRDVAGKEHVIKIRHNGYEPPKAILITKGRNVRIVVDVHYINLRDTLVVVYRLVSERHLTRYEIRLGGLDVEKFKGYLNALGMKNETMIGEVIGVYNKVIGYQIEDARSFTLYDKGLYGEWRIIEHDADRVLGVRTLPYKGGEVRIDVFETDRLVDAKFWNEDTFRQLFYKGRIYDEIIDEMVKYKKTMEAMHINKVYFVFVNHINDELFEEGKRNILTELMNRVGDMNWIEIVNGMEKYG